jgi:hypothetical protein
VMMDHAIGDGRGAARRSEMLVMVRGRKKSDPSVEWVQGFKLMVATTEVRLGRVILVDPGTRKDGRGAALRNLGFTTDHLRIREDHKANLRSEIKGISTMSRFLRSLWS